MGYVSPHTRALTLTQRRRESRRTPRDSGGQASISFFFRAVLPETTHRIHCWEVSQGVDLLSKGLLRPAGSLCRMVLRRWRVAHHATT